MMTKHSMYSGTVAIDKRSSLAKMTVINYLLIILLMYYSVINMIYFPAAQNLKMKNRNKNSIFLS